MSLQADKETEQKYEEALKKENVEVSTNSIFFLIILKAFVI